MRGRDELMNDVNASLCYSPLFFSLQFKLVKKKLSCACVFQAQTFYFIYLTHF